MARIPPVDTCIFCDQNPCICNAIVAKKNARAKKLLKPTVDIVKELPAAPLEKKSHLAAMKAAAIAAPPPAPPKHTRPEPVKQIKHEVSEEDIILQAGIQAVASLLHPDEKKEYAAIIGSEATPEERKVLWKARRAEGYSE